MKSNEFNKVVQDQLDHIEKTLQTKGIEYSRNEDKLHNFNIGVQQSTTGESREEVIWGMARKHWISIQDIRKDVKNLNYPTRYQLDEKFGDMINYLILEKASIIDKLNKIEEVHETLM